MAGIYPQDRYGSPEGLVRILKMADEAVVAAEGLVPTLLWERTLNKSRILRSILLISEILVDYKQTFYTYW